MSTSKQPLRRHTWDSLSYMIVDTTSPYNTIIGNQTLNVFGAVISYSHLCVKYLVGEQVVVICGNQQVDRRCYRASLTRKKGGP